MNTQTILTEKWANDFERISLERNPKFSWTSKERETAQAAYWEGIQDGSATSSNITLQTCIYRVEAEKLEGPVEGSESDEGYNNAIRHCVEALQELTAHSLSRRALEQQMAYAKVITVVAELKKIIPLAEKISSNWSEDYREDANRITGSLMKVSNLLAFHGVPIQVEKDRRELLEKAAKAAINKLSTIMAGNYSVVVDSYKNQVREAILSVRPEV